jgi:Galactose oxidase, central domain
MSIAVPDEVPNVSYGFMFSDLLNRAWLFGGRSNDNTTLDNSVWRFEPGREEQQWTKLSQAANDTAPRVSFGAGCNVPRESRAYYLGGISDGGDAASSPRYHHTLTIFDMRNETFHSVSVPDYVPVANQQLVHIDTNGGQGALVAFSGQIEKDGRLQIVRNPSLARYWSRLIRARLP